ncbi:MAG: hypothetical protein ACOYMN_23870 [Roseimicrobium sp.]
MKELLPIDVNESKFNQDAVLPYGLRPEHVRSAMMDFVRFLKFIDEKLLIEGMPRLEDFLMPANFSSIVGEFMSANIPKYCTSIVKNAHHNGHPDMVPKGHFPNDRVQHHTVGIEVKASRYRRGWQGHNPEQVFLMVFVFDSDSPRLDALTMEKRAFSFIEVLAADLEKEDWQHAGRSATSRRTITAAIKRSGFEKLKSNWIYRL